MPSLNILESFYKTKKLISDLVLDYNNIHACPKKCMLFWKENNNLNFCTICKFS